jgi:cytidylate kinase
MTPSTRQLVITIDGPAGSGKSTTAKLLARTLRLTYLDTGATYRTLAYAAIQAKVLITDVARLVELAEQLPLEFRTTAEGAQHVLLHRTDVTKAIRSEEVSEAAALISQYPAVREAMVRRQRDLANRHGVVVEGRDTGSVVFPHATHKFFLDAPAGVRARRRQQELSKLYGTKPPLVQVQEQLHFRDGLDRTRRVGPLVKPAGAVTINTNRRTIEQVVRAMLRHIR